MPIEKLKTEVLAELDPRYISSVLLRTRDLSLVVADIYCPNSERDGQELEGVVGVFRGEIEEILLIDENVQAIELQDHPHPQYLEILTSNPIFLTILMRDYDSIDNKEAARTIAEAILHFYPNHSEAMSRLLKLLGKQEALKFIDEKITQNPDRLTLHLKRYSLLDNHDDCQEAEVAIREICELFENSFYAQIYLANHLLDRYLEEYLNRGEAIDHNLVTEIELVTLRLVDLYAKNYTKIPNRFAVLLECLRAFTLFFTG